ncbi:unnamed protein product [Danaus chrysippus]|uniref:(African queen) hypothetical protein n=1 Tax=Danaus chrysippus TaxID=151541 RepID=A0A8J2QLV4_9NEOP|nr:unnamed protein product [Danaus chrysippus]
MNEPQIVVRSAHVYARSIIALRPWRGTCLWSKEVLLRPQAHAVLGSGIRILSPLAHRTRGVSLRATPLCVRHSSLVSRTLVFIGEDCCPVGIFFCCCIRYRESVFHRVRSGRVLARSVVSVDGGTPGGAGARPAAPLAKCRYPSTGRPFYPRR